MNNVCVCVCLLHLNIANDDDVDIYVESDGFNCFFVVGNKETDHFLSKKMEIKIYTFIQKPRNK